MTEAQEQYRKGLYRGHVTGWIDAILTLLPDEQPNCQSDGGHAEFDLLLAGVHAWYIKKHEPRGVDALLQEVETTCNQHLQDQVVKITVTDKEVPNG